jgi:hypothetical protein
MDSPATQPTTLLATRPLAPPWDEASKYFAYNLALFSRRTSMTIYTVQDTQLPDLPQSVTQKQIYSSGDFTFFQKLRLFQDLVTSPNRYDVIHYLFTPANH